MTTWDSPSQATVAGRRIVLRKGTGSQTVNICTDANEAGNYEERYRLPVSVDISTGAIAELPDLGSLRAWVEARGGDPEGPPTGTPGARLPTRVASPPADDPWVSQAKEAVERALSTLVEQFIQDPYLHRVEHSLHAHLYALLKEEPVLSGLVQLHSGEKTQVVHKEWPETVAGEVGDDTGPRGNFDLAIISPAQLEQATLDQFRTGRIDAPIAIEIGLDYGFRHLKQDADKLLHSEVPLPYLLHLSRIAVRDPSQIENLLTTSPGRLRAAYVHHDPRAGTTSYKQTADVSISLR